MAATLETLPPEIVLEIFEYLGRSSFISLSLVNKGFSSLIPKKLLRLPFVSPCEKSAINRLMNEVKLRKYRLRQCRLCRGFFNDNEMWLRGVAPVCMWHNGRFESPMIPRYIDQRTRSRLLAMEQLQAGWVALDREMCFHCFRIREWKRPGRDCCTCRDCGRFDVTCLVRVSRLDDTPMSWERSKDGEWIIENDRPARTFPCSGFVSIGQLLTIVSQQTCQELV